MICSLLPSAQMALEMPLLSVQCHQGSLAWSPSFIFGRRIKNQAYMQHGFTFLVDRFVEDLRFKWGFKIIF